MNRIINLTSHEPFNAILIKHTKKNLKQLFTTFLAYSRSLLGLESSANIETKRFHNLR